MKKFKKSRLIVMIIVLILTASALLLSTYSTWFVNGTSNALSLVDNVLSKPFHLLTDVKSDLEHLVNTYHENEELKATLSEIDSVSNEVSDLKEENAQLREMLDMKNSIKSDVKLSADVIARTPASWSNELTVNVGSENKVASTMLVVANGGLIGSVDQVNEHSSRISLLTNKKNNENISVRIQSGSKTIYGIIVGYDEKKSAFIVSQLNTSDEIKEGSKVVTSGLGSYTVANISVGKVSSVASSSDYLTKEVYIKPSADFSDIRVVTLVGN
ncbi:rod shape-determining protein MreC [Streptococcus gordonii]|uniref:rod shape-determining protein MreC n=1 Tax=Streptococcus gordonii TaxID=1302 RepID=UPI00077932AD|nr:rod shape-determining protein MreC [Streptococcus gordonii]MBZ2131898.1 rod shape-determining protein MreC [Streptococcus gordonii]MCY7131219.1 rod shape-determining protein MreC [Streptococcus gordonii]MCY7141789.1 rod shape-determining protein MreC [Streptococcus gordonii]